MRNDILRGNSKSAQDFLIHLNGSTHCGIMKYENGFVPISYEFFREHFRPLLDSKEIAELSAREILIVTDYDKEAGRCREFKIPTKLKLRLLVAFLKDIQLETQLAKKIIAQAAPHNYDNQLYDHNRNLRSKLVRDSIKLIQGRINQKAVRESIHQRQLYLENKTEDSFLSTLSAEKLISSTDYDTGVILRAPFKMDINSEFIDYLPNYVLTRTGRVSERGGFQNMSKISKHAALSGIDEVENQDIRSCQICGLYQLTEEIGIPNAILETYLGDKYAKFKYAEKVGFINGTGGINTGLWKQCLMSTIFGGSFSKGYGRRKKGAGSIYRAIEAEYYGNDEMINRLFENFLRQAQPFIQVIKDWYAKLPAYLIKKSRNTQYGGIFKNACGMTLNLKSNDAKKLSSVSAFILQGLEAAMIHHLVLLGEEYGFKTLSHEHDGIVTIGTIPDVAIQLAKRRAGFKYAELERKSIL